MSGRVLTPSELAGSASEDAKHGPGGDPSCGYARRLLALLGAGCAVEEVAGPSAAHAWAESGSMALTGHSDGAPRFGPDGVVHAAQGAMLALRALAGGPGPVSEIDPLGLLGERAAHFGWLRRGRSSVGGSCRLLRTLGGWIALNLARPEDWELLPAWLERPASTWAHVEPFAAASSLTTLVERARLLGLPVSACGGGWVPRDEPPPWRVASLGPRCSQRSPSQRPRVVDLSSLWAGPLATHLLERAGADVVKVESIERPDGSRRGPASFFDALNAGKHSVALGFGTAEGRSQLARLIDSADIVVESARPRALKQLGIDAESWVTARPGRTWVAITGYGRGEPQANWVAFGDDAAVAAGLAEAVRDPEGPLFCGDAIADPLTGLHAAVAALGAFRTGGGQLLDINLCDVACAALKSGEPTPAAWPVVHAGSGWEALIDTERVKVAVPRARPVTDRARPLGADTAAQLGRLVDAC
jgi:hypothetical protein